MCVTSGPAVIINTRTFLNVPSKGDDGVQRHICGYQNEAETNLPNCMFLNFAGTDLQLVRGPEHTTSLMEDMTAGLQELQYVDRGRGMRSMGMYRGVIIENYGDYTTLSAQRPLDILDALDDERIPANRRPVRTRELELMAQFYQEYFPNDSFVLACFSGKVKPKHPIVVSYVPRDPTVLTIPGLDGHDGTVPAIGEPVYRGFRVAYGIDGIDLPHRVRYQDRVSSHWAPQSVSGFVDNRDFGGNGDYVVPLEAIMRGLTGRELLEYLQ